MTAGTESLSGVSYHSTVVVCNFHWPSSPVANSSLLSTPITLLAVVVPTAASGAGCPVSEQIYGTSSLLLLFLIVYVALNVRLSCLQYTSVCMHALYTGKCMQHKNRRGESKSKSKSSHRDINIACITILLLLAVYFLFYGLQSVRLRELLESGCRVVLLLSLLCVWILLRLKKLLPPLCSACSSFNCCLASSSSPSL